MKLGAQLYSVRHKTQSSEDLRASFAKIAEIGYKIVQISGVSKEIPAEEIKALSDRYALPITCTHTPFDRIVGDTERVIEEHKLMGADTVGLGAMPGEYRSEEGFEAFCAKMKEPIQKIREAGLHFAYHNHAFEFEIQIDGRPLYDHMIENWQEADFIPDTYWIAFGGGDPVEYIHRIGGKRILNIHYKDLARDEKRSICACGDGTLDFAAITKACNEEGIENVLVEQDNAPNFPDAFEEMAKSYRHLKEIVF